ncbi:hypothetical protein [Pandoraea oxalativorans]|uniref:Uncharacterized protein n=1 Tax=Pandoraea oxalativorans TaxID=573737 RepID=A0A0G3IG50_9BURK|nr:hypothetical protein [Pandoraea oxalativorans]AKK24811.1 hypothetical protein MB84_28945 [Pandoraea oxalativorans]
MTAPILLRGNWLVEDKISGPEVDRAAGVEDAAPICKSWGEKLWDAVKDMFCKTRWEEATGYINDMTKPGMSDQERFDGLLSVFGMAAPAQLRRFTARCDPDNHKNAIISIDQSPISIRVPRRMLVEQTRYDPGCFPSRMLADHLKELGAETGFDPKDTTTTFAQHLKELGAKSGREPMHVTTPGLLRHLKRLGPEDARTTAEKHPAQQKDFFVKRHAELRTLHDKYRAQQRPALTKHLTDQRASFTQVWKTIEPWFPKTCASAARVYLTSFLDPVTCDATKRHCFAKMREMAYSRDSDKLQRRQTHDGNELLRLVGVTHRKVIPEAKDCAPVAFNTEAVVIDNRLSVRRSETGRPIQVGDAAVDHSVGVKVCDSQTSFHFFEGRFLRASEPVSPAGNTGSDARR